LRGKMKKADSFEEKWDLIKARVSERTQKDKGLAELLRRYEKLRRKLNRIGEEIMRRREQIFREEARKVLWEGEG